MAQLFLRGFALAIALLATGFALFSENEDAVLYLINENPTATSSKHLTLVIETKKPINVVSGTITYPSDIVTVTTTPNEDAFIDLWLTEPTVNAETGTITFSGGTSNQEGLKERGVIFDLIVSTSTEPNIEFVFSELEVFGSDGQGTIISVGGRTFTFNKEEEVLSEGSGGAGAIPQRDPDINEDGAVTLIDVSILLHAMANKFNERADLNRDNHIGLGDLSILLQALGKTNAELEALE